MLPAQTRPLTVASTRRRTRVRPAAALTLIAAVAVAVAVTLLVSAAHPRGQAVAAVGGAGATAADGRLEVQTYVSAANSFANPRVLDARIEKIAPGSTVLVACRRYVPGPSSFAPYWWYHLVSAPFAGRWVPANSFLNGDPAADYLGPHPHPPRHQHAVDDAVAVCRPGGPGGTIATPTAARVPTFSRPGSGGEAGPAITGRRAVVVSCKIASTAASSEPGGYAYRVASAPWHDRFYAPARSFANAIPADSTTDELVDPEVPFCPRP